MKQETKEQVTFGVSYATKTIREIETGSNSLERKSDRVDHQLVLLLDDVIEVLPLALRVQARACFESRNRLRAEIYNRLHAEIDAWEAQKETSPSCLAATDSF